MRTFSCALIALIVAVALLANLINAQSKKNICVPIRTKNNTIDPNQVPVSMMYNMTNRGRGPAYNIGISLCSPISMTTKGYPNCVGAPGFIVAHQVGGNSSKCNGVFNKPVGRPSISRNGFNQVFGSTLSGLDNDLVSLSVVCYQKAPAKLTSRSHKFAMMKNKMGGVTIYIVAYSAVACGSSPTPPAPGPNAACKPFTIGRQLVNPASWAPAVLDLTWGFNPTPAKFAFSLCDRTPSDLPSWLPDCPTASYITRYITQNKTCVKASFSQMVRYSASFAGLQITYMNPMLKKYNNITAYANVNIVCGHNKKTLYSPSGTYTRYMKGKNTLLLSYTLAHPDLCYVRPTRPTWTMPTRPTGNWTRPTWTFPTRPTGITRPTRPTFTMPTRPTGNWTRPTRFTMPTRPTRPHVTFPPRPTDITKPTKPSDITKPTRPTDITKPTGITRPTPITRPTRPSFTKPTGDLPPSPTKPPQTKPPRPTGLTKPAEPAPVPSPTRKEE